MVDVNLPEDDVCLTAEGAQVSKYRGRYRLVLATNYRDFLLVEEDANGNPARLESFRLAAGRISRLAKTARHRYKLLYACVQAAAIRSRFARQSHPHPARDHDHRILPTTQFLSFRRLTIQPSRQTPH